MFWARSASAQRSPRGGVDEGTGAAGGASGDAAAEGTVYRELVQMTGGSCGDLCLQDVNTDFTNIATAITGTTPVSCELGMPTTGAGAINPATLKLEFSTASNAVQTWTNVSDASACTATSFYYDEPSAPTKIILYPEACSALRQASNPTLDFVLGCF